MSFIDLFANDFKILVPELYLFTIILILLSYGVIISTSQTLNYPIIQINVGWLSFFKYRCCIFTIDK
jgi:hypothetical protein